ncbi:MAG TPA: phosphoribosyltransferase [Microscillaceae bacterium]|nr:phosphoribosyltransferase [Microscillaceae bacterium]
MMQKKSVLLLDNAQIEQKIIRITYQILEENFSATEIVFAGITGSGYALARRLQAAWQTISPIPAHLIEVHLAKSEPLCQPVQLSVDSNILANKTVILIDDVLNTGKTLFYALKPLMEIPLQKIQTVVLINRNLATYPIAANYVGYALATTLNDYIRVSLAEDPAQAETTGVFIA